MQNRPDAAELIAAVAEWIEREAAPELSSRALPVPFSQPRSVGILPARSTAKLMRALRWLPFPSLLSTLTPQICCIAPASTRENLAQLGPPSLPVPGMLATRTWCDLIMSQVIPQSGTFNLRLHPVFV